MIPNDKISDFAHEFLDLYFKQTFGSMTKNDMEVLMFHLMMKYGNISQATTNFEVSCMLKIPESKVKRLRYEAKLKYDQYDEQVFKQQLYIALKHAEVIGDKDIIKFSIEDKFLRLRLHSELKKINAFADTSFNTEVVSVSKELLGKLLEKLYLKDNAELIMDKMDDVIKKQYKKDRPFLENFNTIVSTTESFLKILALICDII